jgi:hypothetical protein
MLHTLVVAKGTLDPKEVYPDHVDIHDEDTRVTDLLTMPPLQLRWNIYFFGWRQHTVGDNDGAYSYVDYHRASSTPHTKYDRDLDSVMNKACQSDENYRKLRYSVAKYAKFFLAMEALHASLSHWSQAPHYFPNANFVVAPVRYRQTEYAVS